MQHQLVACLPSLAVSIVAVRDLAPPGDLISLQTFSFEFNDVEMQYDSYKGLQVRLRSDFFCLTLLLSFDNIVLPVAS